MADIVMPQLGESVTEGTITRWFKQVGETVQEDEPLFEVSTDKVDTEVPSPESGTLSKIVVEEGETVDVGTVLAVIGDASEAPSEPEAPAEQPAQDQSMEQPAAQGADGGSADSMAQAAQAGSAQVPEAQSVREHPEETQPVQTQSEQVQPGQSQPTQAQSNQAQQPPADAQGAAAQRSGEQDIAQQMDAASQARSESQREDAEPIAEGRLLSPLVRRLVEEHRIDPSTIDGTGVGGRITREDVLDAIDARDGGDGQRSAGATQPPAQQPPAFAPSQAGSPPAPAAPSAPASSTAAPAAPSGQASPATRQPSAPAPRTAAPARRAPAPSVAPVVPGSGDRVEQLNKIRMLTGDAMVASKRTAPHAVTIVEVDYEAVEKARRAVRELFKEEEGFSLTYLPFISRAVVDALHEFPHMNASMGDGSVVLHDEVNLSIAVDLDYEGLLAPVVQSAHGKRLRAIARDIHDLAARARSKNLSPDDLSGGTFTLTNSGSFGTAIVVPIINQPQVAIMSTDGISRRPVVVTDDFGGESIGIHSIGNLTLAWDHRAFDGAYAAAFMSRVKEILETRDWSTEL